MTLEDGRPGTLVGEQLGAGAREFVIGFYKHFHARFELGDDSGLAAVVGIQGYDPRRGAAVDVQSIVVQQDISLDAKAQFRLSPVQGIGLPPPKFSGSHVHRGGNGAVSGGASGGSVSGPIVAQDNPAAQRPCGHEPVHDVDESLFRREFGASQQPPVGRIHAV